MKILITGGAGYIATHTIIALLKEGYQVVAIDNFSNSSFESIKITRELTGVNFPFYEGDVRDLNILDTVFKKENIDAVIHFAGLKAVGESCEKPLEYYENNIVSTLKLLQKMREYNVKKLIFSSSATVYGLPEVLPITEESPLNEPLNPYGATKRMIEDILKDIYKADNSWHIALLRYFNPVGAHESGRLCENPQGIPNNLMPYVAKVAMGELPKLNVFGNDYNTPDGTCIRDYIHIMDLAEGHVAALNVLESLSIEAINLGTGVGYSVLDMVKAFEKSANKPIPYVIAKRRAGDSPSVYADPQKAKKILNWQAKRSLNDMCNDLYNAIKNL